MSEHCVFLVCGIDDSVCSQFITYLVDLHREGATKLTIAISSPGGGITPGVTTYNAMISMPYEIITHNIGNSDFIATAVFMGGSKRYANNTATFMFHGAAFNAAADERLDVGALQAKLGTLDADHNRIASLISERSGIAIADCLRMFDSQSTRDASWSKSVGIITKLLRL